MPALEKVGSGLSAAPLGHTGRGEGVRNLPGLNAIPLFQTRVFVPLPVCKRKEGSVRELGLREDG